MSDGFKLRFGQDLLSSIISQSCMSGSGSFHQIVALPYDSISILVIQHSSGDEIE